MEKRQPKSPYQRYQKSPYLYSSAYQLWREEAMKNGAGTDKALALACSHAKYVSVKHYVADGSYADDCVSRV